MTADARGAGLRLAAAMLIGLLAMVRTMVMFAGQRWFDVDPSVDPNPLSALGPAGSQLIDVLLLVAAGVGIVGLRRGEAWPRGRAATWGWTLLIPAAVVLLWHGRSSMDDQWIGSSWIAAVVAGAVAGVLARERGPRAVLVAILLAAMVPVMARGLMQVRVGPWTGPEHARTLDEWGAQRQAFFADRGWTEDSPAARIFERRLRQPQPTGWFATTNVFATMAGVCALIGGGLAIAAARARSGASVVAAPAAVAAAAIGLLALTGAKGAWAATLLGSGVLLVGLIASRRSRIARGLQRAGPWVLVLAVIPGMLGLTVVRGLLPEDFAGDRSLLFRWHYLVGAAGAMADAPALGAGADGFQVAYLLHRPMRSPEEVSSVHAVAVDWLVAAGVAAAGWILMLAHAVVRMGRGVVGPDESDVQSHRASPPDDGRVDLGLAVGIAGAVCAAMFVEIAQLEDVEVIARLVGGAAAVLVAVTVRRLVFHHGDRVPGAIFAGAGVLAVAHAQIELTATQPAAVAWWAVAIGTCAAAALPRFAESESPRPAAAGAAAAGAGAGAAAAAAAVFALSLSIVGLGLVPAARQGSAVADAAGGLAARGFLRMPVRTEDRIAAATRLGDAAAIDPAPQWVRPAIARQFTMAIRAARDEESRAAAVRAASAVFPESNAGDLGVTPGLRIALIDLMEACVDAGEPDVIGVAIELAEASVASDPHGVGPAARLTRLLERAGRRDEAAAVARIALALDAAKELDPAKQLGAGGRGELERIAGARDSINP